MKAVVFAIQQNISVSVTTTKHQVQTWASYEAFGATAAGWLLAIQSLNSLSSTLMKGSQ